MAVRPGHGKGKGVPRVETKPIKELPLGVQVDVQVEAPGERDSGGRFTSNSRTAQRQGGHALSLKSRLARKMGLNSPLNNEAFEPYKRAGGQFRKVQVRHLALTVGGG